MENLKQFMLAVLVALASCATMCAYDFSAVNSDGVTIYYNKLSDSTCEVNHVEKTISRITIPSTIKEDDGNTFIVVSIGDDAFYNCYSLTSITIPESVTKIGDYAFSGCTSLTSITIPERVTAIGTCAFEECSSLTSINIPESVTKIGDGAFLNCSSLTSINIPESVTSISSICYGCTSLTSITIPESVTSIGELAFYECSSLTSITIPESVTSIGRFAFYGCKNLTEVTSLSKNPPRTYSNTFEGINSAAVLRVPVESINDYKKAEGWKEFKTIKGLPEISLVDSEGFSISENQRVDKITYTRTFNNTALQPLYVPFSMSYSDWCEDFEVYRINMFSEHDTDDDGIADETVMEIIKVKEGNGALRANYPYLIRAKEAGEKTITVEDATLHAAEANSIDCSTVDTKYTFTGTYQKMTGLKSAGYYGMSGGSLCLVDNDMVELGAFRWYLKVEPRGSQFMPASAPRSIKVRIAGEDEQGEATGIAGTEGNGQGTARAAEGCYNLQGMRVGSDYRGIVIKNGKKMIVK